MALRGNLRDFSLPDVFQLITFSKKTGVLRIVRSDGASGSVWFNEGDVFFASSNWRTRPLGERLVSSQRITPQALTRALELRALEPDNGRRLGQILVDEAYITQKVLESFVQEQIQDTIFDLMRWDEGDFDFEPMPTVVEEDIGLSVSIENIVMEGSRRLEEWARIKKKIPSMDVVFKMATAPGEGTFEISLKPMEWELLVLVDGSRSVAELAVSTSRTDFEVARVIYGLFSAGLLEFASEDEVERNRAERAAREAAYLAAMPKQPIRPTTHRAPAESAIAESHAPATQPPATIPTTVDAAEDTAVVIAEQPSYSGPEEVPQFLDAAGVSAPTQEDQAVLEEFMGSLLGATDKPAALAVTDEATTTACAPSDEPAFLGSVAGPPIDGVVIPTVEELLAVEPTVPVTVPRASTAEPTVPTAEPDAATAPEPPTPEPVHVPVPQPVAEPEPAVEPTPVLEPEPTPEPESVPAPQTEADIRAVAAAHSADAESPIVAPALDRPDAATEPFSTAQYPLIPVAPLPDIEPAHLSILEPASAVGPTAPMSFADSETNDSQSQEAVPDRTGPDFARDLMALGLGELRAQAPETHELAAGAHQVGADFTSAVLGVSVTDSTGQADLDVSGIIASLGDQEADDSPVSQEAGSADLMISEVPKEDLPGGFDRDLIEEATDRQPTGVISTDAFVNSELGGGLSSSLNDELSALTGAERRTAHSRPQVSVKPLGATGEIRRDPRVDRETLLKIIDGLERL